MALRLSLAAFAVLTLPAIAAAEGCPFRSKEATAPLCAEGMVRDAATGLCVVQPSS